MKKKVSVTALLAMNSLMVSLHAGAATPPAQAGNSSAVLLQGFHWNSAGYANPNGRSPT